MAWKLYRELAERAWRNARTYEWNPVENVLNSLGAVKDKRKHQEAFSKVEEMRTKARYRNRWYASHTFIRDPSEANAFSKVHTFLPTESAGPNSREERDTSAVAVPPSLGW